MFNTVEKLFHPRVMTEWCQKCVNSTLLELHDLFLLDLSHRTGIDALLNAEWELRQIVAGAAESYSEVGSLQIQSLK